MARYLKYYFRLILGWVFEVLSGFLLGFTVITAWLMATTPSSFDVYSYPDVITARVTFVYHTDGFSLLKVTNAENSYGCWFAGNPYFQLRACQNMN